MEKIKELTDFYMWMQKNEYDHNIRARVERKAEMYLSVINVGQTLPLDSVVESYDDIEDEFLDVSLDECPCCGGDISEFGNEQHAKGCPEDDSAHAEYLRNGFG